MARDGVWWGDHTRWLERRMQTSEGTMWSAWEGPAKYVKDVVSRIMVTKTDYIGHSLDENIRCILKRKSAYI